MRAHQILIPMKFYSIIIQLILTIVVCYTKSANINAQIEKFKDEQELDYDSENSSLNKLIIASFVLLSVELIMLFMSYTIFLNKANTFQIIFHTIADLCLSWFIWKIWISEKYWVVFSVGVIIPFIMEVWSLLTTFKRKIVVGHEYFY